MCQKTIKKMIHGLREKKKRGTSVSGVSDNILLETLIKGKSSRETRNRRRKCKKDTWRETTLYLKL